MSLAPPPDTDFRKAHGATILADWLRVRLFADIIAKIPGLSTPTPRWMDRAEACIGYAYLPDLRPSLNRGQALTRNFARIRTLLARFHAAPLESPLLEGHPVRCYPLEDFGLSHPEVAVLERSFPAGMFFGDCWHGNIFMRDDRSITFLDPLPNRWIFDSSYLRACGALDLAMLHMSLYFCHPLARTISDNARQYIPVGTALIDGYLSEVRAESARPALLRLSRILATRYISAYSQRLRWPLAITKQWLSKRVMYQIDKSIEWRSA
jgi:hypothetical protein